MNQITLNAQGLKIANPRLARLWHTLLSAAVTVLLLQSAQADLLTNDVFNYAINTLGQSGSAWSSSKSAIRVATNSLDGTPLGLVASSGNKVWINGGSSGVDNGTTLDFANQTSNGISVYCSFLFQLSNTTSLATSSPGTPIVQLNPNGSGTKPILTVNVLSTGGNIEFGVSKYDETTTAVYTQFITSGTGSAITAGTTYLVVVKYSIVSGLANDTMSLWINPASLAGAEDGSPQINAVGGGTTDMTHGIGRFYVLNGFNAFLDELRIGTNWADVTPSSGPLVGAKLGFTTQPANTAPNATMSPVVVQVQTSGGASVSSNGVPITLTLSGTDTLSGTTSQNTDSSGKATFSNLSIDQTGMKQLIATASGIGAGLTSSTSSVFSVVAPSQATKLAFTTQPANTMVNATMSSVVVQIQDANGIAVSSNNVPIAVMLTGPGTLGGATTQSSDATGKATFSNLTVDTAGTGDQLTASASGIGAGLASATSSNFNITTMTAGLQITHEAMKPAGLEMSGVNGTANALYQVIGSPDVSDSVTNWLLIGNNNFDGSGGFITTNPVSPALPKAFYMLRVGPTNQNILLPGISQQPADQTVAVGGTATFTVVANGGSPFGYLWYFNSNAIPGATSSTLTINNAQPANAGAYYVLVANVAGSIQSSVAHLRVGNISPSIVTAPQSVTVSAGSSPVFSVVADGTIPLHYQWTHASTNLPNATNASITLVNVQTNDTGSVGVQVSNAFPPPASASATLTVTPVPSAPPDTNMLGFAAVAGVTGGAGGADVYATNYASFSDYVHHPEALIIHITNMITEPVPNVQSGYCYVDGNNKTIIGDGTNAVINGVDVRLSATNLIVANLTFQVTPLGSNDGITIDGNGHGTGKMIWVDHCTISNAQDGSIDITKGADEVTVSWCKFIYGDKVAGHVHEFVHLIGSSDSDGSASQLFHVTLHHNWYGTNCVERMPSVRWGRVHVFNCLYTCSGNDYCARTRIGSQVLVENNFFVGSQNSPLQNPWELYVTSGTTGLLRATNNNLNYLDTAGNVRWVNAWTSGAMLIPGTDSLSDLSPPPYDYTNALNSASDAAYYDQTYSGAGKYPYVTQ